MPFSDLDAADGVELWSFVTDTAERLRSLPEALRFAATPDRVVDHPPERNMSEWDRLCSARRVPASRSFSPSNETVRVPRNAMCPPGPSPTNQPEA